MYSRDVFPKYSNGGMPIPENYSGNAIRRPPPRGVGYSMGGNVSPPSGHTMSGNVTPPAGHTHGGSTAPSAKKEMARSSPRVAVPLTVSPSFAREAAEEREASVSSVEGASPMVEEMRDEAHVVSDGMPASMPSEDVVSVVSEDVETASVPREGAGRERQESGISSLLSMFLPPKPGGGGLLSHIGLEETLLLGLFLLLSQSEEEEDTLMLLALLFLYR